MTGSTSRGDFENTGSCGPSDSREIVYEIDVHDRQRFTFAVEAKFDTVLYVRKDACADPTAEVDCNDDAPDRTHSRVEHVLDPGKYFLFVDGYGHESGAFKLTVTATPVLALSDVCQHAPWLAQGPPQGGAPRRTPTTPRPRAATARTARSRRGRWSCQRVRGCVSWSTPTTWRPSSTSATPAPIHGARSRAASRARRPATPP